MSEPVFIVLAGIVGTVIGGLIAQLPALRRGPQRRTSGWASQARLDEARADHEQHESAATCRLDWRSQSWPLGVLAKLANQAVCALRVTRRA